jgi:hypothetical protein
MVVNRAQPIRQFDQQAAFSKPQNQLVSRNLDTRLIISRRAMMRLTPRIAHDALHRRHEDVPEGCQPSVVRNPTTPL